MSRFLEYSGLMKAYDHKSIEKKWQKVWEEEKTGRATSEDTQKKKTYLLVEFPFPSGAGLHAGHVRSYTAMDILARKRRMEGENVLYPIGWDAFGLPTENFALKTGKDPRLVTKENTDIFRRQLKSLGISFDWSREVNTTDPRYYKWTQWIFIQMWKKGLAYKATTTINWCPKCKIGLANEEVVAGACERCGYAPVEKREKEQWMLAITKYAQRLYDDLDGVDYIERAKTSQRNWIGPSEGAEIDFALTKIPGQEDVKHKVTVFTTRPDTLFGATYLAVSAELAQKWCDVGWKADAQVVRFIEETLAEEKVRQVDHAEPDEKKGVATGIMAINPATGEEIPVWVANYVLSGYGTGAIMAVPAHDERDYEFAKKFDLPVVQVIEPRGEVLGGVGILLQTPDGKLIFQKRDGHAAISPHMVSLFGGGREGCDVDATDCAIREAHEEVGIKFSRSQLRFITILASHSSPGKFHCIYCVDNVDAGSLEVNEGDGLIVMSAAEALQNEKVTLFAKEAVQAWMGKRHAAYVDGGILVNSDKFNGMTSADAQKAITASVGGTILTRFKLRDWVFSRQRYWGEPIPMINCPKDGWVPVPEKDLPLELPKVEKYQPTDTGESPLAKVEEWVKTTCPTCGGPARRETDVMPNWAGSSWYYLRYLDPANDKALADPDKLKYWTPVDWYNGGMEHTTLHLLYSRFWHKFLFDIGAVPTNEPYQKRTSHGIILAEDGDKMSKSKGNVVNPDDIVERYGADTLRVYEMFMGPFDQAISWNENNIIGPRRFIERVWNLSGRTLSDAVLSPASLFLFNSTIKKLTNDIESLGMNTAVAALMTLLNAFEKEENISDADYRTFLRLLAPFAPHVAEELWSMTGGEGSIHQEPWPLYDESKTVAADVLLPVQVNGKVRATIAVPHTSSEEEVDKVVRTLPDVAKWLEGRIIVKRIYVTGKIINYVVKEKD